MVCASVLIGSSKLTPVELATSLPLIVEALGCGSGVFLCCDFLWKHCVFLFCEWECVKCWVGNGEWFVRDGLLCGVGQGNRPECVLGGGYQP